MVLKGKFLEGGPMPADPATQGGAPAEAAGGDPMEQVIQGAMQAVQAGDGNLALQVCQMLIELAGGGGQPAPAEEAAPAPTEGEPVYGYRNGGSLKILRRIEG